MKKLVIIGRGKLAESIKQNLPTYMDVEIETFSSSGLYSSDTVFLHIGSGREYTESLSIANSSGATYIQASTEKGYKLDHPTSGTIRFIHAPNLDINIIKLIHWMKIGRDLFQNEEVQLLESHQEVKRSKPGTAIKFGEYIGVSEDDIVSIRDLEKQRDLNIKNIEHHAFHRIIIGDENSSIKIETKVEGAISYSRGIAQIISVIDHLEIGNYEIEDLVERGVL